MCHEHTCQSQICWINLSAYCPFPNACSPNWIACGNLNWKLNAAALLGRRWPYLVYLVQLQKSEVTSFSFVTLPRLMNRVYSKQISISYVPNMHSYCWHHSKILNHIFILWCDMGPIQMTTLYKLLLSPSICFYFHRLNAQRGGEHVWESVSALCLEQKLPEYLWRDVLNLISVIPVSELTSAFIPA